mgnify:CR=1 FL=1
MSMPDLDKAAGVTPSILTRLVEGREFNAAERQTCIVCGATWLRHFATAPCQHSAAEHGRAAGERAIGAARQARAEAAAKALQDGRDG